MATNRRDKSNSFFFHFAALFFTAISFLYSNTANAGCDDDSQRKEDCSASECRKRYELVHPTCDVRRSCAKKTQGGK